jgi:hypothetical protein
VTPPPVPDANPEDPVEILRALPEEHHEQFRREYEAAATAAQDPSHFPTLRRLLHFWRLFAAACTQPGYAERVAQAKEAARSGDWSASIPLEDVIAADRAG